MSLNQLLDWNASTGMAEGFHVAADGDMAISETQNVDHILQSAKEMSELTPGKEWRHAAYIPEAVWNQACREGWVNDRAKWKEWANNPDNKAFRTWPGKL